MPNFYPYQADKDHVLVNINLSVMIGVNPGDEDIPREFCDLLREHIKATGAVILASSIVNGKRMNYIGSAREKIINDKENPLNSEGE